MCKTLQIEGSLFYGVSANFLIVCYQVVMLFRRNPFGTQIATP